MPTLLFPDTTYIIEASWLLPILLDKNFLKLKSYSFRIWFRLGVDFSESEGDPTLLDSVKSFSFNSEFSNSSFFVSNSNSFSAFCIGYKSETWIPEVQVICKLTHPD